MTDAPRAPGSGGVLQSASDVWRVHIAKAMSQPYLMALMIGSTLLSAASFFTTFDGMLNFMPVLAITFCIVFAIQALLFVASWRLGFAVADREPLPLFTVFVFLICLATSVFFSWVSLFETINDPATQERTRVARMQRVVEETSVEAQRRAEAALRERGAALLSEPGYAAWTTRVDGVAQAALASRGALDAARDRQAAKLSSTIQSLEAERAALLKGAAAAKSRSASAARQLRRLDDARGPLVARIAGLRADVDAARVAVVRKEGEMKAEERGGASGGGTGRGPVWRALRDQRAVLQAELETKSTLLAEAEQALADSDDSAEALRVEIAEAEAGGGSAELGLVEARLAQMKERIGAIQAGERSDVGAEVGAMRGDLTLFETGFAVSVFDRAAARCETLLDSLRANKATSGGTAALTCDREPIAASLSALRRSDAAVTTLAARCAPGGSEARSVAEMGFKDGVAHGRECVALSGLPATELSDLRARFDRLTREEGEDASAFVKTVNAWAEGDKLSYFALAIALFIDLLVLLSGLIGAVSVTSAMGRAFGRGFARRDIEDAKRALSLKSGDPFAIARAILEIVEPSDDRRFIGEVRIDDAPAELRGGVRQFMLLQSEKRLAERKAAKGRGTDTAERPLVFLVRERVLSALRAYLEETALEREEAAQRRAAARPEDEFAFLLEHLGAPERRAATLDVAFRAMKPPGPEPRDWLSPADWLRPRATAEIQLRDVRSALRAATEAAAARTAAEPEDGEEPVKPAKLPTSQAEIRRLCFALFRRGLARPMPTPFDEPGAEAPGYRLTERAMSLLERAAKLDAPARSEEPPVFDAPADPPALAHADPPALAHIVDATDDTPSQTAASPAQVWADQTPNTPDAAPDNALHAELEHTLQRFARNFLDGVDQRQREVMRRTG